MNNIFKVIWNHATQTWTAVGELASAKGKSKSVKLAAISTALLVVASSAQAEKKLLQTAENDAGLSVSVVNTDATTGSAKAYAYDGIAIGNNSVAGQEPKLKFDKDGKPVMKGDGTQDRENAGNAHIAIGLNAQAGNNGSSSPAVALGANSKSTDQGTVAVGNASSATSADTVAIGNSSVADSNGAVAVGAKSSAWFHGSALGEEAKARGIRSTALGNRAQATSDSAISIGFKTKVEGQFAIGIGRETSVTGKESVAVGNKSTISSANVSTLGANITVEAGRDGGVVLGHSSDAGKDTTKVVAVNNATVGTLTYSDFKGNLSKSTELQGRFVSVGKEGGERQIKHVAAGQITKDSTDAINGSQLYSVANTLGTAAKGLADTLGVTLGSDGTVSSFSQPLNIAKGSSYNNKDKDGKTITAPNVTTALTNLNNYVNEGWKVTTSGNGYDDKVSVGHTVNFVGSGIVDVDGSTTEDGVRTVNISVDSPLDYASTTVDGKPVAKASDGKWYQVDENGDIKEGAKPVKSSEIDKKGAKLTDSDTENNPYEKGNSYTYDDKGNITATGYDKTKPESKDNITAGKNGVQLNNVGWATKPDQAVNKDQLDQTVNKSGFYVQQNGKSTLDGKAGSDEVSDTEKVTPNDVVNFADGHGTRVRAITKRDETTGVDKTTFYVDVYEPTKPNSLPAVYTDENGNKLQPGGNGYYPADAVKINDKWYPAGTTEDNVAKAKELTPVSNVIISMNNPNSLANTAGDPVAVTNVGKGTKNYDDQTAGEKSPAYKDAINGLANLEGSKDSNVLTVADAKNFGWVVSTSDNQKATAVKNADVVDFKAEEGTGITVEGKLDDTNTKMTVTVGNKHFKTNTKNTVPAAKATGENSVAIGGNSNAAAKDAIAIGNGAEVAPTAAQGSVAIGAGAKAGKANVGSYSIDPSATVAGKTGPDTRVVSVGDKGNEAQIQNVAPGVISETSTDAVNGSQLHATNEKVASLGTTVNNLNSVVNRQAGAIDSLDRKVNKHSKQARAGIAGANAAAALPQAYTQGKAMVAAAAGTFKGQNALAVGYSRISDNGKVILKLQGNANTSGDVGAGVGVGYQW